jgi:hypothetical protein
LQSALIAEPNGTIIVEPFIEDVGRYVTEITIENSSYPISSLDYVYKIDVSTGALSPVSISDCTVASGGLTFEISTATAGDYYLYGYNYGGLSRIASLTYTTNANLKASVNQNVVDIKLLQELIRQEIFRVDAERNFGKQIFTSDGTFTAPKSGIFKIICTGGGASGYRIDADNASCSGGGAGATAIKWVWLSAGTTVSVTIGQGGAYPSAGAKNDGTDSTFGGYCTGGKGVGGSGTQLSIEVAGGAGGTATNGDINISGGNGGVGDGNQYTGVSGIGGVSYWGGEGAYGSGGRGGGNTANVINATAGVNGIVVVEW